MGLGRSQKASRMWPKAEAGAGALPLLPGSCWLPSPSGLQEKGGIHKRLWKGTRKPEG